MINDVITMLSSIVQLHNGVTITLNSQAYPEANVINGGSVTIEYL